MARSDAFQRGVESIRQQARLFALIDKLTFNLSRAEQEAPLAGKLPLVGRVVVGVGTDPATSWALEWAQALGPVFNPRVTLVHVEYPLATARTDIWGSPPVPMPAEAVLAQDEMQRRVLDEASQRMRSAGLDATTRRSTGAPTRELLNVAREEDADLVVVGSSAHGALDRFLVGSVADGVKNHAATNVLLAKGPPVPGNVLCPVDESWMSKRAAALALRIAQAWGSTLHVIHVLEPPAHFTLAQADAQLQRLHKRLGFPWRDLPNVDFRLLLGNPAKEITLDADRLGAHLVVMGNRGMGGLRSVVSGSVTNHVTHHVPQSLLLVKGPKFESMEPSFVI